MKYFCCSLVRWCFAVPSFTFVFSSFLSSYGWFGYRLSSPPSRVNYTVGIIAREWCEWLPTSTFVPLVPTWVYIFVSKWERVARKAFPMLPSSMVHIHLYLRWIFSFSVELFYYNLVFRYMIVLSLSSSPLQNYEFHSVGSYVFGDFPMSYQGVLLESLLFTPCFSGFPSLSGNFTISSFW